MTGYSVEKPTNPATTTTAADAALTTSSVVPPFRQKVHIAYLKVAKMQTRGAIHFPVILRLDGAPARARPSGRALKRP